MNLPIQNGPGATGIPTAATAMNPLTSAQATNRIHLDHGSITVLLSIADTTPVMIVDRVGTLTEVTLKVLPIHNTVTHSICMARTVLTATYILAQHHTNNILTAMVHGIATIPRSTAEPKSVPYAVTVPLNMQAILFHTAPGLHIMQRSISGRSAVPADTVQLIWKRIACPMATG